MLSLKFAQFRRYLLLTAAVLAVLSLIFWGAVQLCAPGFIKNELDTYGKKIGYEITYRHLSLSPLRLRLEIEGLSLGKEGGAHLLELQQAVVMLKWSRLIVGEIGFDEILLDQPVVLLERGYAKAKTSFWNWEDFIHAVNAHKPSDHSEKSQKVWRISVDEFRVNNAALNILDASSQLKEYFKLFSIELLDIANYDQNGQVNGVRGQYDLNLGALNFVVPGVNKKIGFQHVALSGQLDNSAANVLAVQLDLQLDKGKILSHWSMSESKALNGEVKIEELATTPLVALIPTNKDLFNPSGVLNSDLLVKWNRDTQDLHVNGDLHLLDFLLLEPGEKLPLLGFKRADVHHFVYDATKSFKNTLSIEEVLMEQPVVRFEVNEQGFSNFRRLFSKTETLGSGATTKVTPENKSPFQLDIATVKLHDGEMYFSDLAMRPNFKVDIKKFNASLLGMSNTPGRFATLALDGVVAGSGSMRAKGRAAFDDPRRNNNIVLSFKNLPLTVFNPAIMTFAGYQITGGRLSLNLNYHAKDGDLNGSNQIVIKKVELGDEVVDFQGKKLPLGLAIALLEDSDDTIDVTINIAGNVDSPQFSATGLIWQAISNVLTNVATAPFRALAAVLGMGSEQAINAVPGEAIFLVEDEDRLLKFGDYLAKRPNANLELAGTYDAQTDKAELARVTADTAILKNAGFKLSPGEPVPLPSLADPRVQSGLKTAYGQQVGRIKLGQRLLLLPDDDVRNEQLRNELIASIVVTDEQLASLAKNRAKLAQALLTKNNPTLAERIQVGEVRAVLSNKDGVPLEVELRIK
jgi:hypothetical protein